MPFVAACTLLCACLRKPFISVWTIEPLDRPPEPNAITAISLSIPEVGLKRMDD